MAGHTTPGSGFPRGNGLQRKHSTLSENWEVPWLELVRTQGGAGAGSSCRHCRERPCQPESPSNTGISGNGRAGFDGPTEVAVGHPPFKTNSLSCLRTPTNSVFGTTNRVLQPDPSRDVNAEPFGILEKHGEARRHPVGMKHVPQGYGSDDTTIDRA